MEKLLQDQKIKAKNLWITYLKEQSVKKSSTILHKRQKTMDQILRMQTILFLNYQLKGESLNWLS